MSYHFDKDDNSIVIDGWEQGDAVSPHKGIGSLKCANISTEAGEVMCNYARLQNTPDFTTTGTFTAIIGDSNYVTSNKALYVGGWVSVTNTTNGTWLPNGTYFITDNNGNTGSTGTKILLSTTYKGTTAITEDANPDTATFTYLANGSTTGGIMSTPVQGATEWYFDSSGNQQNRYYVLDTNGHVWVHDTSYVNGIANSWSQIDITNAKSGASLGSGAKATGLAVYNGWLFLFIQNTILIKMTDQLGINVNESTSGIGWTRTGTLGGGTLNTPAGINNSHFAYTSKSGALYYTDSSFIGSIFATAGTPNLWSYATYTFSTTTITLGNLIGGVQPYGGMPIGFFSSAGTNGLPTGVSASTTYYVKIGSVSISSGVTTFQIASTPSGSAISLSSGSGTQYYNTFDPTNSASFIFSPQALTIPQQQDQTQCITEIGDSLLIGCKSNTLYFWDGIATTPNGFLFLPEENTVNMITVNNMAYIFSGSRGNIYITNGNTSSMVITVPDYITQTIDPYFTWGGAMYARGRVWFSIQDNNSLAGGIWSFVPTQNLFIGQDTGLALRMEHQSSYGTYAGFSTVLISQQNQQVDGLQYFSAWYDGVSSYGIDASSTSPYTGGQTVVETDFVPVGTYLNKANFTTAQTKYTAKLVSGESVQLKYRTAMFDAWSVFTDPTIGTDNTVGSLGARFPVPFAQTQSMQFQIILTSTATNPSFTRFKELRLKK